MAAEVTEADLAHLRRCVELAEEAVAAGGFPFGSVLVAADGTVVAEDRNREETEGDPTSCRMKFDHTDRWKRGDWDCTIQYGGDLTATAEEFHLKEWVVAKKGDVEIFRRETPSTIKRDLL